MASFVAEAAKCAWRVVTCDTPAGRTSWARRTRHPIALVITDGAGVTVRPS